VTGGRERSNAMPAGLKKANSSAADSVGAARCDQDEPVDPRRECESPSQWGKSIRRIGTGPRFDRTLTLATAAAEYIWLYDLRHGLGVNEIALRAGVTVSRVRYGLKRAQAQERPVSPDVLIEQHAPNAGTIRPPRLVPLFPIVAYTPQSTCPHRAPIEPGSALCCMVCHCSGMDDHPALQRDPQSDPSPEPKPAPPSVRQPELGAPRETRRQRRRRQFAQQGPATQGSP
jgi:hypothetical protein